MLKKKFANIAYWEAGIGLLLALLAILVGSFKDYAISAALVKPDNAFGLVFSYLGGYPAYVLFGAVGVLFWINYQGKSDQKARLLALACAIVFPLLAGSLYGIDVFADVITSRYLQALLGIVFIAIGDVGVYFLCRKGDPEQAYTVGLTFLFAFLTVFALTYLLKKAGLRPRYLFLLLEKDPSYYRDWWEFDPSVVEAFPDLDSSYFESWPSGHAALSALSFLSVLLCPLVKNGEKKTHLVLGASYLFCLLTSAARVSDGHHYLSDVGFGAFFALLFAFLVVYLVYLPAPQEESEENVAVSAASSLSLLRHSPHAKKRMAERTPRPRVRRRKPRKKAL